MPTVHSFPVALLFTIALALATAQTPAFAAHEPPSSKANSSKSTTQANKSLCEQALTGSPISPLFEQIRLLTFSEASEIETVAVDFVKSLRIYAGNQKSVNSEEGLRLEDLYKSLRISQRKFFELKNTIFDTFVRKGQEFDSKNIELLQRDLEYWLDHLSEKYLRDLMSSFHTYIHSMPQSDRDFEVTTTPYFTSNLENQRWFQKDWVVFTYYDQEWDLWVEFLTVAQAEPEHKWSITTGKPGLLAIEELLTLLNETQLAMDNIKQMSQFLVQYPNFIKELNSEFKDKLTEELFVMAGVSYERLGQILDKVMEPSVHEE